MRGLVRLEGSGVSDVWLAGGVHVEGSGDDEFVSYAELEDLYHALGRSISLRSRPLTAGELRFLRKRLRMSQAQVGALGGKSDQAAAKWEKGAPIPVAESNLVRLAWLARFSRRDLAQAVRSMTDSESATSDDAGGYVLVFRRGVWDEDRAWARELASNAAVPIAARAITKAREQVDGSHATTQTTQTVLRNVFVVEQHTS